MTFGKDRVDGIPPNFLRNCLAYKNKLLNVSELARVCAISRTTVYRYIGFLGSIKNCHKFWSLWQFYLRKKNL